MSQMRRYVVEAFGRAKEARCEAYRLPLTYMWARSEEEALARAEAYWTAHDYKFVRTWLQGDREPLSPKVPCAACDKPTRCCGGMCYACQKAER